MIERCNFDSGDVIDRRYQVENVLGEGTFGVVYAVRDSQGKKHALKLLRLWDVHPMVREGLLKRFDMEFQTGQIDSEYLVHSTDHGKVYGNPYIVMELCNRGDLITLSEHSKLDLPKVAHHVLYGLEALHECGKVHRDLKPENVLLRDNGNYALTDFGICGDRNNRMTKYNLLGQTQQIFGTYAYMPPEQLKPKKNATVLPTTDIFSFGVMIYQLIVGELPFGQLDCESDLVSYLKRAKNGKWDKDKLLKQKDGKIWVDMIDGCLEPLFQNRIQSVEEVLRFVPEMGNVGEIHTSTTAPMSPPFQTKIVNGVLLRVMQGDDYGRVYYLDAMLNNRKSMLTMGRKDDFSKNDIAITEESSSFISRRHCTLELDYNIGSWIIRDGQWNRSTTGGGWTRSTNGTYVNSTEVSPSGMPFCPGDIISVGETKMRVEGY